MIDAAREEIARHKGAHFDPEIASAFTKIEEPHTPNSKNRRGKSPQHSYPPPCRHRSAASKIIRP